jgi:hypothetical protein
MVRKTKELRNIGQMATNSQTPGPPYVEPDTLSKHLDLLRIVDTAVGNDVGCFLFGHIYGERLGKTSIRS